MPKRRVSRPRVKIWVGVGGKPRSVEGFIFLPGLIAHPSPNKTRKENLFNITLKRSGYAIVTEVPKDKLDGVKELLKPLKWFLPPKKVAESQDHFRVAMEAQEMAWGKKADRYHEKQEKKIAEEIGGRVQPGSGSRWGYRRDVVSSACQVEAKWTDKLSFNLVLRDWEFLRKQALLQDRIPVYVVEFRTKEQSVVVVEANHLNDLLEDIDLKIENPTAKRSFRITHDHSALVAKEKTIEVRWGAGNTKRTVYITSMMRLLEGTRAEGE